MKNQKRFKCDYCNSRFTRLENVRLHQQTTHSKYVKKAICPWKKKSCHSSYSTKENLQVHLKKHHNGKKIIKNKVNGREIQWIYVLKDPNAIDSSDDGESGVPLKILKNRICNRQNDESSKSHVLGGD